jgi:2-oxoglutarate dehydrogenase E2 component (dihydrolipoamide succinyltransferase)
MQQLGAQAGDKMLLKEALHAGQHAVSIRICKAPAGNGGAVQASRPAAVAPPAAAAEFSSPQPPPPQQQQQPAPAAPLAPAPPAAPAPAGASPAPITTATQQRLTMIVDLRGVLEAVGAGQGALSRARRLFATDTAAAGELYDCVMEAWAGGSGDRGEVKALAEGLLRE